MRRSFVLSVKGNTLAVHKVSRNSYELTVTTPTVCFPKELSDYYPYLISSSESEQCISLCLALRMGQ